MLSPDIAARIVEPNQSPAVWIQTRDIGPFIEIASTATQSEILNHSLPPMLPCNDMIDNMLQRGSAFRHQAILAYIASAAANLLFQCLVHRGLCRGSFWSK